MGAWFGFKWAMSFLSMTGALKTCYEQRKACGDA
jgi:hypothetical protein